MTAVPVMTTPQLDYGAALWTVARVKVQLEEAALTIRRLPSKGSRPGGHRASWPDVVREISEAYGYGAATLDRLALAPGAIDRADEAMSWLFWLDADQRRLVWARANRIKWRHLERRLGRTTRCLQLRHRDAMLCIVARLTQNTFAVSRNRA